MSDDARGGPAGAGGEGAAGQLERTPAERRADHAAIDRLADELLPALVAKLGASGLGELDVREGRWRVRLRMPGDGRAGRRPVGPGRSAARTDGHAPARTDGHTQRADGHAARPDGRAPRADQATGPGVHAAGRGVPGGADRADQPTRAVATSPAVGYFRPHPGLAVGARVRAGDRVGTVDVLGVPQEVQAPADGVVGVALVEAGEPVEYGQEVLEIELLPAAPRTGAPDGEGA